MLAGETGSFLILFKPEPGEFKAAEDLDGEEGMDGLEVEGRRTT